MFYRFTHVSSVLSLLLFLNPLFAASQNGLQPGKPIEREISGSQKHSYSIRLEKDQAARLIVQQRGVDVVIRLQGSGNEVMALIDDEPRNRLDEAFEIVAETSGEHRFEVEPASKAAPTGTYRIQVASIGPASVQERVLYQMRKQERALRTALLAGEYTRMREVCEQSLAIVEQVLGKEHRKAAFWKHYLADYYEKKQDYPKAVSIREQALAISEHSLGPEHPFTLDISRALAHVYHSTNDVAKAESTAARALELLEKELGTEHLMVARGLLTYGYVTVDLRKPEPSLKRALQIAEKTLGPDDPFVGTILNHLAIFYSSQGNFEAAEPLLLRAQAINEQELGRKNVAVISNLMNLGLIARQKKDYETAQEKYRQAIALVEDAFGPENPRIAMILNNVANIYRAKGEYAKSLEAHHRVLRISEATRGPYHPLTVFSLGNIAKTYAAKGDIEHAIQFQSRVDRAIERNIDMNLAIGSESQKLLYLNSIADRVDRTISLHADLAPDRQEAAELAALIVLQRKGRVLDAMSESFSVLRRRATAEEQELLEQYNDVTAELARLVLDGPERMSFEEHQSKVREMEARKERLEAEISRRSAEFRAQSQPVDLASIRAAIPSNAALIEFFVYRPFDPKAENNREAYKKPRYIAYILRQAGNLLWKDLGDAAEIDLTIDVFRKALRDPKSKEVEQVARAADQKLMEPIRPLLTDATHLLISPDGALNLIPFEAMVDEENRYLIERFSFSYLTSGRDLLRLQIERESKTPTMVLANPMFGEPGGAAAKETLANPELAKRDSVTTGTELSEVYFAPLAGTAQEAKAIRLLFPEASVFTGAQATESSLKGISAPRILHIATHGFFLTEFSSGQDGPQGTRSISTTSKIENPLLRSGLALAGANLQKSGGKEDGILTALEASGLNLWGTKLVTLSACDTGVGEILYGQGVYGLRRAFVLSGTETLVMSLWPVSDFITRDLMASYYKGLKRGLGRGEALRQMQLGMLKRKERRHPFFWAGFIQSGQWKAL